MWAQYGEGHSGVCFAFDREELDRKMHEELGGKGQIYSGSVDYTENELELYDVLSLDADLIASDGIDTAIEKHIDLHYKKLFLQKDADWRDENEYRWIVKTRDMSPEYVSIENSIRAIFLGIDFPFIYHSAALECAKELKIPLFKLKWHNGRARLSDDMTQDHSINSKRRKEKAA